jgi:glycosyltransferase involved in cell wall biosynthesis
MSRGKIAMVVINSVSHDARVNKEAASLARVGFDLTVVGIQDNLTSRMNETTPDGVKIHRVLWRAGRQKWLLGLLTAGFTAACTLAIITVIGLFFGLTTALSGEWFSWVSFRWDAGGAALVCLVVAGGFGWALLRWFGRIRREYQVYLRYLAMEGGIPMKAVGLRGPKSIMLSIGRRFASRAIHDQMVRQLSEIAPDVVHCHDLNALPIGVTYKKRAGCRLVYDSHEIYEEVSLLPNRSRRRFKRLQRSLSSHVDKFITINESIGAYFRDKYPRLPKATIIMNATEFDEADDGSYDGRLHLAAGHALEVRPGSVVDWAGLAAAIKTEAADAEPRPGRKVWDLFGESVRESLLTNDAGEDFQKELVVNLDSLLDEPELYCDESWKQVAMSKELGDLVERHRQRKLDGFELRRMNLLLLEAAYPQKLARSGSGISSATKILLYQGGFAQFRGLDKLVEAAGMLPADWILVMMGWGAFEEHLRSIARKIDPRGRKVRFIPPAPRLDLVRWTRGATVGVIPYENVCMNHWFCTPNKLWEYPAGGVPILASPFPEMRKVVEGHGVGWLLDDPLTPCNAGSSSSRTTGRSTNLGSSHSTRSCCRDAGIGSRRLVSITPSLLEHQVVVCTLGKRLFLNGHRGVNHIHVLLHPFNVSAPHDTVFSHHNHSPYAPADGSMLLSKEAAAASVD